MPKPTNKEKALIALLECVTVREAAQKCGLSEATLYLYLKDGKFKKEYKEARRLIYEENVRDLQRLHKKSVETIERNLDNPSRAAVEVRAAALVIKQARADFETEDILERLEVIEDVLKKQNQED
jgi:hypothetical protein